MNSSSLSVTSCTAASTASERSRIAYVDAFRGLLIAHMALDHASLMFNAGRGPEELAAATAPHFDSIWQFLTRFTGVPVAPGFFFMAGFMVAMTSIARVGRGMTEADVTRRLLIRGAVLILADAVIMGLPRALMGFYSFMVLSSIGVAIIAVALLRRFPNRLLLPVALVILVLHPLIDVSALPAALRAVLYEPVRDGAFRSLYPVIPWSAIVLLGFVVGRDAIARAHQDRSRIEYLWLKIAATSLTVFLIVRLSAGFGNAYAYESIASVDFWMFAKYPPDLPFLTWSFACLFLALALLSRFSREGMPVVLRPFEAFGRVSFFFYIVHFYVLGIAQAVMRRSFDLPVTFAIWIALLAAMVGPCIWYYRMKTERPNLITKYF